MMVYKRLKRTKKPRTSAEQPGNEDSSAGVRPTKKFRTSVEQLGGEDSSVEQLVPDGPLQGTVCFITHHRDTSRTDMKVDMFLALHAAMKQNPDAIIVCSARVGATAALT